MIPSVYTEMSQNCPRLFLSSTFRYPRIVLNFIPDLYPVVLIFFLSFILYHGCYQCYITQVNRVLKTLPVLPVYHVYIVLPFTFYLVAIPQLLNQPP